MQNVLWLNGELVAPRTMPQPPSAIWCASLNNATLALLKQTIAADPFPMSLRVRQLRAILEKLEPSPNTERRGEPTRLERW